MLCLAGSWRGTFALVNVRPDFIFLSTDANKVALVSKIGSGVAGRNWIPESRTTVQEEFRKLANRRTVASGTG